jgi:hypothetical protein
MAISLLLMVYLSGCSSRVAPKLREPMPDGGETVPKSSIGPPVSGAMSVSSSQAMPGETVEIIVHVEIGATYHIYASNAVAKTVNPTTIDLTLPHGVEALGDWSGPEPTRRRSGELVYTDSVQFRRLLKLHAKVPMGALSIKGTLRYQACTEEICWPPRSIQLSSLLVVHSPNR